MVGEFTGVLVGVGVNTHGDGLRCSISVAGPQEAPTAHTSLVDTAATPLRSL
jgi:hypothetical protein